MVDFENDIKACVAALLAGGTILYPTDTVWGIGCDALDEAAVEKVFALKRRPKEKSLVILLADARDILRYVAAPPPDVIAIVEAFDRPTTVVYDHALELANNAVNSDGSVAIRVTTDPFCRALIKRLRRPLVSTSANVSGSATPAFFADIEADIRLHADYVVAYRQNDNEPKVPSRIIRMDDEGVITVIRD